MELFLQFFSFCFPKAGSLVGSIPITVALLLLAFYVFLNFQHVVHVVLVKKVLGCPYLILILIFLISIFMNYGVGIFTMKMAEGVLYIISPLAVVVGWKSNKKETIKCIYYSVFIVSLFALIQFLWGIEKTKIPGLTIMLGDSYSNKTIGYGQSGVEAIKMPSTYQVGNAMGIFLIQMLPIVVWDTIEGHISDLKKEFSGITIFFGVIAVFLSGSRSAIVSTLIVVTPILYSLVKRMTKKQFVLFTFLVILAMFIFGEFDRILKLGMIDRFYNRYIRETFFGTSGNAGTAGRTNQWSSFFYKIFDLSILEWIRFLFCGLNWNNPRNVEGILYVMSYYGVIAFFVFSTLLIRPIKLGFSINKFWGYSFLSVFIVLCVDRTFCSTPTLMNYFFMFGMAMQQSKEMRGKFNEST